MATSEKLETVREVEKLPCLEKLQLSLLAESKQLQI